MVKWRWYYNLFITFLISGLWHGANWTFIMWGALHGFYLTFGYWTQGWRNRISNFLLPEKLSSLRKLLDVLIIFHLVTFAWIFFRANSLQNAQILIESMFNFSMLREQIGFSDFALTVFSSYEIKISLFFIILMEIISYLSRKAKILQFYSKIPVFVKGFSYLIFIYMILQFGVFHNPQKFIYFQF